MFLHKHSFRDLLLHFLRGSRYTTIVVVVYCPSSAEQSYRFNIAGLMISNKVNSFCTDLLFFSAGGDSITPWGDILTSLHKVGSSMNWATVPNHSCRSTVCQGVLDRVNMCIAEITVGIGVCMISYILVGRKVTRQ